VLADDGLSLRELYDIYNACANFHNLIIKFQIRLQSPTHTTKIDS